VERPHAGRAGAAAVGSRLGRGYGLHRRVQSPRCLGPGEVEPMQGFVWYLGPRSHEGYQAARQATGTHPPIRGGDALNPSGPSTELAITPGADLHQTALPSQNPAVSTPGLSNSISGRSTIRCFPQSPRRAGRRMLVESTRVA
jgi:hypothetical protein